MDGPWIDEDASYGSYLGSRITIQGCKIYGMSNTTSNASYWYLKNGFKLIPVVGDTGIVKQFPSLHKNTTKIEDAGYYQCLLKISGSEDILSKESVDVRFVGEVMCYCIQPAYRLRLTLIQSYLTLV